MLKTGQRILLFAFFPLTLAAQQTTPVQPAGFVAPVRGSFVETANGSRLFHHALDDSCELVISRNGGNPQNPGAALVLRDRHDQFLWSLEWMPANPYCDYICITSTFTDETGNIYASGRFKGQVDLDPGQDVQFEKTAHPDASDGFLIKLDETGKFRWAKTFGGQNSAYAFCDLYCGAGTADGNILFMGSYAWSVDFNPGNEEQVEFSGSADPHPFILRLDTAGQLLDVHVVECSAIAGINSYSIDEENNYYITYYFHDSINLSLDKSAPLHFVSAHDYYNTCTAKYNSRFELVWARHLELDFNSPVISTKEQPFFPLAHAEIRKSQLVLHSSFF
ncbi:MAG: hypothetical protein FD123_3870 [Bacteroidetes bacterium]|nr:MAG: hypothetical protein FD123_3870 [Bacteroidota bacterium]